MVAGMTWETWWLFMVATFFISAAPGPNMLLVLNQSVRCGFGLAMWVMAGCMTALLIMFTVSAAGLGLVLLHSPHWFNALRWLGAAYLFYLGYKVWVSPVSEDASESNHTPTITAMSKITDTAQNRPSRLFFNGFLTAASNPKAILFAAAFLPQFINPHAPQTPQIMLLLASFSLCEISWYVVYALGGVSMAHFLRRPRVLAWFNRVTGGGFMLFAALMASAKH